MSPLMQKLQPMMTALHSVWQRRTYREQQLLSAGAAVFVSVLLWSTAIAPALSTWREAPTRQAVLDLQSSQMQELREQVQALKKPSVITRTEAIQWLEATIPKSLGKDAKWSLQGEQLSLSLSSTPADQLATWLSQAREQAQVLPAKAQLQLVGDSTARISGTFILRLP